MTKTVTVIEELGLLRGALDFIQSLAEEELPFAPVGSGHEVALRHIERRAREALAAPRACDEPPAEPSAQEWLLSKFDDEVRALRNEVIALREQNDKLRGVRSFAEPPASEPAPADSDFTNCRFVGPPPAPYASWAEWASHPQYTGVTISASEKRGAGT